MGAEALLVGLDEPSQGLVPEGPAPMDGSEWGKWSPDAQEGRSGELQEAHGQVPGLSTLLPQSLEEEPRAEERKAVDQGEWKFRSELTVEARGLKLEHSELPQLNPQPAPRPPDRAQAEVEAEAPAPRKPSEGFLPFLPMGAQPGDGAGVRLGRGQGQAQRVGVAGRHGVRVREKVQRSKGHFSLSQPKSRV